MRSSSFKLAVVVVLSVLCGYTASRADDFQWEPSAGPPQYYKSATCAFLPPCMASSDCQVVNPAVSMVPDAGGGKNAVLVKSYKRSNSYNYGTCSTDLSNKECYAYPSVMCGSASIYGDDKCAMFAGGHYVYAGNCTP